MSFVPLCETPPKRISTLELLLGSGFPAGDGDGPDGAGVGLFEDACAFVECRAGGHHVVNEQDAALRDPLGAFDLKCARDVCVSLRGV